MSYFLSPINLIAGQAAEFGGNEARHIILSRRMKAGERFKLQGPDGKRYAAEFLESGRDYLKVNVLEQVEVPQEPVIAITLVQAVVAEQALDVILQKAVELGAAKVILFDAVNTPAKYKPDQIEKKFPRWQKIMQEASKQCERGKTPALEHFKSLQEVSNSIIDSQIIVLDANGNDFQPAIHGPKPLASVFLVVGPEGGLDRQEIDKLKNLSNVKFVKLSPFILRSETAAIAGLAVCRNAINQ